MSAPVLDGSIAVAWVLADETSTVATAALERVTATGGVAPVLWWAEVRNALVVAERRGRIAPADTETALAALDALHIRLDHAPDSAAVLRLARAHELSAYDAIYLELAMREGRILATIDRKLARAAGAMGTEVQGLDG